MSDPSHSRPAVERREQLALELWVKGVPAESADTVLNVDPRTVRRYWAKDRARFARDAERRSLAKLQETEVTQQLLLRRLLARFEAAAESTAPDASYQCAKLSDAVMRALEASVRIGVKLGSLRAVVPPEEVHSGSLVQELGVGVVAQLVLTMAQVAAEPEFQDAADVLDLDLDLDPTERRSRSRCGRQRARAPEDEP